MRDHAKPHNRFEGSIPRGANGAGVVMLWDFGTYASTEHGAFDVEALRADYEAGAFSFVLFGQRLAGRWMLTRRPLKDPTEGWIWDLQKCADQYADRSFDPVAEFQTSAVTNRTMAEIAAGKCGAAIC